MDFVGFRNATLIPLNTEAVGDAEYLGIFMHVVCPIAREFDPELVLISAGFDGLRGDAVGNWNLSPLIYAHLVRLLQTTLPSVPLCLILENCYNPSASAQGVKWTLKALLGDSLPSLGPLGPLNPSVINSIWTTIDQQKSEWRSLAAVFQMFSSSRQAYGLEKFQSANSTDLENKQWRRKTDSLMERGLFPTRSDKMLPREIVEIYAEELLETIKRYKSRSTSYITSVCFPAGSDCIQMAKIKYSSGKKALFLQQNRVVSNLELDLLNA